MDKDPKILVLENISSKEMQLLTKCDSNTLAIALVFVVLELIALDEPNNMDRDFSTLLTQAGEHALDLVNGVH